jgi:hypothetical protein
MEETAASPREEMAAAVRAALLSAGALEFGHPVTQPGEEANARNGFTVTPTGPASVIVTFRGPPPETRPIRDFLASYAAMLEEAGFSAEARFVPGYVAVDAAGPGTGTED